MLWGLGLKHIPMGHQQALLNSQEQPFPQESYVPQLDLGLLN